MAGKMKALKGKKLTVRKASPRNTVEIVASNWPEDTYRIVHAPILATFKAYGETFVVHRSLQTKAFVVAHLGTGALVESGETKDIAVKHAKSRLREQGRVKLQRGIRLLRRENLRRKRLIAQEPAQ